MQKIYLSAIILVALNTLNLQNVHAKTLIDSIGVENVDGLKVILYKASTKETYYSIARRYNVSAKELLIYNDNQYLKVGTIIKVPTKMAFNGAASSPSNSNTTSDYFSYTTVPKDNLNLLAEKYGTTIRTLKEINGFSGSNLSIGQVIKIPLTEKAKTIESSLTSTQSSNPVEKAISPTNIEDSSPWKEYVVKPKEFLNKIAEDNGISVEELKKANDLTSSHLRIGQKLKIPRTKTNQTNSITNQQDAGASQTAIKDEVAGMHKVVNGENIFTLAKKFGITAYQIRQANNLADNNLKVGQLIKIPSNIQVSVDVPIAQQGEKPISEIPVTGTSFKYLVAAGDDIYTIAKKFDLTTYQIKKANNMAGNKLLVGQELVIPKPPEPQSVNQASLENQKEHPDSLTLKDPKLRRDPSVYGLNQVEEKGMGVWIADQDLDGSKMLVLHRTAPIGTVIKITNPMTNISTFAKVVGKFTENESTKDVIIVMTKAVAESLGALDKRFMCDLMYSAQ